MIDSSASHAFARAVSPFGEGVCAMAADGAAGAPDTARGRSTGANRTLELTVAA